MGHSQFGVKKIIETKTCDQFVCIADLDIPVKILALLEIQRVLKHQIILQQNCRYSMNFYISRFDIVRSHILKTVDSKNEFFYKPEQTF